MKAIIICLLLLTSCSIPPSQTQENEAVSQKRNPLQLIIPNTGWEPIFFQSINERASIAKLPSLRSAALKEDQLEVRVWHGFGLTALEGLVLRDDGEWTAVHVDGIHPRLPRSEYQKHLQAPKSGWHECWVRLVEAGISTLPDASEIQCSAHALDGMSYVVELNLKGTYRTYLYDNPSYAKCDEAKRMIKIGNIISEEFGLLEMGTKQ
jgi:hypothetical protein